MRWADIYFAALSLCVVFRTSPIFTAWVSLACVYSNCRCTSAKMKLKLFLFRNLCSLLPSRTLFIHIENNTSRYVNTSELKVCE